jgi:hypothetical protein
VCDARQRKSAKTILIELVQHALVRAAASLESTNGQARRAAPSSPSVEADRPTRQ